MDNYLIELTRQDLDQILAAIGHRPFNEVAHIMNGLYMQSQKQDAAREARRSEAERALYREEQQAAQVDKEASNG